MIYRDIAQKSDEWKALRLGRVTGTRAKTVLFGGSAARKTLINTLIDEEILCVPLSNGRASGIAVDRGNELEAAAASAFSFEHDIGVLEEVAFVTREEKHMNWIGLSPDRVVFVNDDILAAVEIKCPMPHTALNNARSEMRSIPDEYLAQVYWNFITIPTLETLYFVVYCPELEKLGKHLLVTELKRDHVPIDELEKKIKEFREEWLKERKHLGIK